MVKEQPQIVSMWPPSGSNNNGTVVTLTLNSVVRSTKTVQVYFGTHAVTPILVVQNNSNLWTVPLFFNKYNPINVTV